MQAEVRELAQRIHEVQRDLTLRKCLVDKAKVRL